MTRIVITVDIDERGRPEITVIENKDQQPVSIDDVGLSVRAYNLCKNAELLTLQSIACNTRRELLRIKYMGMRSLNEIVGILSEHGLKLKA